MKRSFGRGGDEYLSVFWMVLVFVLMFSDVSEASGDDKEDLFIQISSYVRKVYDKAREAVVRVEAKDAYGVIVGTGFRIDGLGTVCTAADLLKGAEEVRVDGGAGWVRAEVIVVDEWSGLGLVRTEAGGNFLKNGDGGRIEVGMPVVMVGCIENLEVSPSFGVVAGILGGDGVLAFRQPHILCSFAVMPGQIGSPILDKEGNYIGVIVGALGKGLMGVAVCGEMVEKVRTSYIREGCVRHGWLGVRVRSESGEGKDTKGGVWVAGSVAGSPAQRVGLMEGKRIGRVNGTIIDGMSDFVRAVSVIRAGEEVELELESDGKTDVIMLRAADLPWTKKTFLDREFVISEWYFPDNFHQENVVYLMGEKR
ncbi:MAG: S1C family serine protease [Chthoniobacterales bacterium]|nr:S1C family serine protease [Chthoniobacterales bacterium]